LRRPTKATASGQQAGPFDGKRKYPVRPPIEENGNDQTVDSSRRLTQRPDDIGSNGGTDRTDKSVLTAMAHSNQTATDHATLLS